MGMPDNRGLCAAGQACRAHRLVEAGCHPPSRRPLFILYFGMIVADTPPGGGGGFRGAAAISKAGPFLPLAWPRCWSACERPFIAGPRLRGEPRSSHAGAGPAAISDRARGAAELRLACRASKQWAINGLLERAVLGYGLRVLFHRARGSWPCGSAFIRRYGMAKPIAAAAGAVVTLTVPLSVLPPKIRGIATSSPETTTKSIGRIFTF